MKRIAVFLVVVIGLIGIHTYAFSAYGPDDLTVLSVSSYMKQREIKLSGGWWMYSFKVNVASTGKLPLGGVCGQVRSSSSSVKVIDREVCFPDISAGGSATSKGTFTIWTNKRLSGPPTNLSWTYSSLKITADPSSLAIQQGTPYNALSYYVTLSTSAPKKYYVLFHQAVPQGITITEQPLLTREMDQSGTWYVTEFVNAPAETTTEITARAWILNTLQRAETTVPVSVTSTPPPPRLGNLGSQPSGLWPNTTTDVQFTIALSGSSLPENITLQKQVSGAWVDVGTLTDKGQNGDVQAGDAIYGGVVTLAAPEGTLVFRATSPSTGGVSPEYTLTVTPFPTGPAPKDPEKVITISSGQKVVGNRLLVRFLPGTTKTTIESVLAPINGTVANFLGSVNVYQVEIPTANEADLFAALAALKASPSVIGAQPVNILEAAAPYNFTNKDAYYDPDPSNTPPAPHQGQWNMKQQSNCDLSSPSTVCYGIGADYAWPLIRGSNVTVAVLDYGVDVTHPDFEGGVTTGINYTSSTNMNDGGGHGTKVAGIIGARGNNSHGIAGMAWESPIVSIKVCDNGGCSPADVIDALDYAVNQLHVKVINMSIYNNTYDTDLAKAVARASTSAVIVVAAGNDGSSTPTYPAAYPGAIAVAATTMTGTLKTNSNHGDWVHLAAPGEYILTLRGSDTNPPYVPAADTSLAAPHVSGAAALLCAYKPQWSSNTIRSRLLLTAHHPNPSTPLPVKYGMLDAYALLGPYDPGTIDTSFGNGGVVVANGEGEHGSAIAHSLAIDPMGRIVVAGWRTNISGNINMTIWRYNSDGTPDLNFGSGTGFTESNNASVQDIGYALALDRCGLSCGSSANSYRIVVSGMIYNPASHYDMAIWRYLDNGTPDYTFGSGSGFVVHNAAAGGSIGDDPDQGYSLVLDSWGRILVAGYSVGPSGPDMVIWRYDSSGSLDSSFGGGQGFVVYNNVIGNDQDLGLSLAIDLCGLSCGSSLDSYRILVTGYSVNSASGADMAIWRYLDDGTPDGSFGGGLGFVTHNSASGGNGQDIGRSVILDSTGKILVAGDSQSVSDYDMVIWRYKSDGALDTDPQQGFGQQKGFVTDSRVSGGSGASLAIDSSRKIVVSGSGSIMGSGPMVIWRYNPDGTPDPSFGNGGIVLNNGALGTYGFNEATSMVLDDEGRILVAGYNQNSTNQYMFIWRYLP